MTAFPPFFEQLQQILPRLLASEAAMPADWQPDATTYDLPRFYAEAEFGTRFARAVQTILTEDLQDPAAIKKQLTDCGHPSDYARLGHPLSTVYELYLQSLTGAEKVLSFASQSKPFLAVIEARQAPLQTVKLFAEGLLPVSASKKAALKQQQVEIYEHWQGPLPEHSAEVLSLYVCEQMPANPAALQADAVCFPLEEGGVLLIYPSGKIQPQAIQVIRKRTAAALLAANAKTELCRIAGLPVNAVSLEAAVTSCDNQLRDYFPQISESVYFCTGLAAEAAVFQAAAEALASQRPVSLFYAQNGYGGTGQLIADVLPPQGLIVPAPLPVLAQDAEGNTITLIDCLIAALEGLQGAPACVFLETPTNPELQVHDFAQLMVALKRYQQQYGQQIPVLVDTTLAPLYPLFAQDFAQDWPFVLVKSGSKYFTKGKAILGVVCCAQNALARRIVDLARQAGHDADTLAKSSQMQALAQGLQDLKPRMARIASHTRQLAEQLRNALQSRGQQVTLYTMTDQQLEAGLASGILSFYLPPAATTHDDLVDEFVDYLLMHTPELVKNRVSYGQSSRDGLPEPFYIINPQESTQGSLSASVKAAQKKDNVQICRISVPEHAEVEALVKAMNGFFDQKYGVAD